MTAEGMEAIRQADKVLYGTAEPLTEDWILRNAKSAESLDRFYLDGQPLMATYEKMISAIVADVRSGLRVCACFEGHAGVFVLASHESLRILRAEGYRGRMLPGISTQEALFCDLGIDPGEYGYQSLEATDFLLHGFAPDVTSVLVLWQVSAIADYRFHNEPKKSGNLAVLAEVLEGFYGKHHTVLSYQAPVLAITKPVITRITVQDLAAVDVEPVTLCIPPLRLPRTNDAWVRRLGP